MYRTVIFVNGCFWHRHGCKNSVMPATRVEFWEDKFRNTERRDREVRAQLRRDGWTVVTIWECGVRDDPSSALKRILRSLK